MTDFLATYLLHSSIVLGVLRLLACPSGWRKAPVQEVLLKGGLVTPLFTALIVTFLPALPRAQPSLPAPPAGQVLSPAAPAPPNLFSAPVPMVLNLPSSSGALDWGTLLFGAGVLLAVLRFLAAARQLHASQLGAVDDPVLQQAVLDFRPLPVRLTWTALPGPHAWGRRSISLPTNIRSILTPPELEGVLAHEYAHLLRRDPLWNAALSFLTLVFWFQPLNWLALRDWRSAAEELCDAWAARRTSPLTLAQALLKVARQAQPAPSVLLSSSVASPSHLTRRITALLNPPENVMNTNKKIALFALPILLGGVTMPLAVNLQNETRTVVLDAGHGGIDPGAVAYAREAEEVQDIALRVEKLLVAKGVKVIHTPREHQDSDKLANLKARAALAVPPANFFVSIHADASTDAKARGLSAHYDGQHSENLKAQSKSLAEQVLRELTALTGAKSNGAAQLSHLSLLRQAEIPAVLVEVGYVTNAEDGAKLNDPAYRQKVAEGIARAILVSP